MKKSIILIMASLLMSNSFASLKQTISLCLDAPLFHDPFQAQFTSSDVFDGNHGTPYIFNEKACVSHTYNHGPKNIKFKFTIIHHHGDTLLAPGKGCEFLHHYKDNPEMLVSDYVGTPPQPNINWKFRFVPTSPEGKYANVFTLECERSY